MEPLETPRLRLRDLVATDAAFVVELVNDPTFLRCVGDRDVHSLEDAGRYVERVAAHHARHGFGLQLVERRADDRPVGICGLLRRDGLDAPDLAFAMLAAVRGHGYAEESSRAVMERARETMGLTRLLAITDPENAASIRLLGRLGFRFVRTVDFGGDGTRSNLYEVHG